MLGSKADSTRYAIQQPHAGYIANSVPATIAVGAGRDATAFQNQEHISQLLGMESHLICIIHIYGLTIRVAAGWRGAVEILSTVPTDRGPWTVGHG